MDKLANVHDLDGDFIPFSIGSHGAHALLTGSYHRLGTGRHNFSDFISGNTRGQVGVDHFQIATAATATAVLPIVG